MSLPDKSIDERLIKSAKEVFLDKGFEMAQLSEICQKAGVTTGALYKRFDGKEELFYKIVSDTIETMESYVSRIETDDLSIYSDQEIFDGFHMNPEYNMGWLKYLYDHKDDFILLIKCSHGTRYTDFHSEWSEKLNKIHYKFYQEAKRRGLATKKITEKEMNVLTTAVWTLFYKPFILEFSWNEIKNNAYILSDFINWNEVLGIKKGVCDD